VSESAFGSPTHACEATRERALGCLPHALCLWPQDARTTPGCGIHYLAQSLPLRLPSLVTGILLCFVTSPIRQVPLQEASSSSSQAALVLLPSTRWPRIRWSYPTMGPSLPLPARTPRMPMVTPALCRRAQPKSRLPCILRRRSSGRRGPGGVVSLRWDTSSRSLPLPSSPSRSVSVSVPRQRSPSQLAPSLPSQVCSGCVASRLLVSRRSNNH
jgi:hypothetical protein